MVPRSQDRDLGHSGVMEWIGDRPVTTPVNRQNASRARPCGRALEVEPERPGYFLPALKLELTLVPACSRMPLASAA